MIWEMWLELGIFAVLLGMFFYMFAFGSVTRLHRVYLSLHIIFISWPLFQFIAHTLPVSSDFRLYYTLASYVGLSLEGIGWLVFTIFLTGQFYIVRRRRLLLLSLPALAIAAAVGVNPGSLFLAKIDGVDKLQAGPIYWVMISQLFIYLTISLILMIHAARQAQSRPHKSIIRTAINGLLAMYLFGLADLIANLFYLMSHEGYLPLFAVGLVVASFYLVHAIARQKGFDLIQIAQRDMMNTIPTGILVLDDQNVIVEVNRMLRKLSHLRSGEKFDPNELAERMQAVDKDAVISFFQVQEERKQDIFELEIAIYSQGLRYIVVQSVPIRNQRRVPIGRLISFQDVSELRMLIEETNSQNELLQERNLELLDIQRELSLANRKLEQMAITDGLTGCYNRRYLLEQLDRDIAENAEQGMAFSIVMFDIDLFKSINDTYGHLAGDYVLQQTVAAVRDVLRSTDIFARYGGEEFTVYLPDTTREQAAFIAERIKEAVQNNIIRLGSGDKAVSVTVSIGIVSIELLKGRSIEKREDFIDILFEQADSALYEAKFNGRNRIVNRKLA